MIEDGVRFCRGLFPCFVGRQRAFFCNFCVSLMSDERFSAFSACRLQAKRCFWQFSKKNHKRQPVFGVFRSSLASETLFSAFSAFRSRAMNDFQGFSSFRRGGKCSLRRFSVFPSLGKPIFSVFHASQCWEMRFSAFFVFPRGWKCDFWHFSSFQPLGSRKMLKPNSCYFRTATNVFSCENVVEVLVRIAL